MRARMVVLPLALLGLATSGCLLNTARRDGAPCSRERTCPPGQQCSSDGQCLYPCPLASCFDNECGCGGIDRGSDTPNGGGGWTCMQDRLCHPTCNGDRESGIQGNCWAYMSCDPDRWICLPACNDDSECGPGAKCHFVGGTPSGGGQPPNYCLGTGETTGDGGVPDGSLPGTFDLDTYATPDKPLALAAGKITSDSFVDLSVISAANDYAYVLSGNGDGTFAPPSYNVIGDSPFWVGLGHFNDDSWLDFIFLDSNPQNRPDIRMGGGDTSMQATWQSNLLPFRPSGAVVARLDHGYRDGLVAISTDNSLLTWATMDASGQLWPSPAVSSPVQPMALTAADLDGDNLDEILIVSGGDGGLHLWHSDGAGVLSEIRSLVPVGTNTPFGVAVANFDQDSRLDVVVLMQPGAPNAAFTVVYNWPDSSNTWGIPNNGAWHIAVFTGDFDGDGRTDIGTLNKGPADAPEVVFFFNQGDGTFGEGEHFGVGGGMIGDARAVVGRFNDDACDDVAVVLPMQNKTAVLWSKGCMK